MRPFPLLTPNWKVFSSWPLSLRNFLLTPLAYEKGLPLFTLQLGKEIPFFLLHLLAVVIYNLFNATLYNVPHKIIIVQY